MRFIATADTDIGISRKENQDAALVKHASVDNMEILMAVICDGMGGLAKGELASATVIRSFSKWFEEELPYELEKPDMQVIAGKWTLLLRELNLKILEYSKKVNGDGMGTTFSGILFVGEEYLIVHVGDTRVYHLDSSIRQLTEDQTFVANEIKKGIMTEEQARTDKRRNLLLQCVGASKNVEPQILYGRTEKGAYLLCSDGFRHEITSQEIFESLKPLNLINQKAMHGNVKYLIDQVKRRGERDNISTILIKVQ